MMPSRPFRQLARQSVKHEPSIDRARLIEAARDAYGIAVDDLAFVPLGYAAACYALSGAGERRYFLKLWPDTDAGRAAAERQPVVLPLMRALVERGLCPRVPAPLSTRDGGLSASFAGRPFAVFPFLAGHAPPPWSEWPLALRDELARTIAAIHRATPALADVLPPRDAFDIPFEADLRRGLDAAERIGLGERPGLRALRDLVAPRRVEIMAQLARLHRLQDAVRRLPGPAVLCHTDIGGDNLLLDDRDRLWALDWDDAIVAPPEHDLQCGLGADFGRFLSVYAAAGGAHPLHLDHFAFYLLRRYLGDMTARLVRILHENTTEEEDQDALDGMVAWGFDQWAALDDTLAEVKAALDRRDA
jgi:aminoglycoside phosphotransferase (APT) family kinase protein